jgi:hypothetical protein
VAHAPQGTASTQEITLRHPADHPQEVRRMGAIPLTAPAPGAGQVVTATTPTASDTIASSVLGDAGCNLRIQTAGTGSNITISDSGSTPAGNTTTATAITQGATQIRMVYISPKRVDVNGLVTITSSSQATMTYELYPA